MRQIAHRVLTVLSRVTNIVAARPGHGWKALTKEDPLVAELRLLCRDEVALIEALQQGRLRGAALDVFEQEPLPLESPLLQMDNVLLSPHNTNSSPFYWERVHWNTLRNLLIGLDIPVGDISSLKALEKRD